MNISYRNKKGNVLTLIALNLKMEYSNFEFRPIHFDIYHATPVVYYPNKPKSTSPINYIGLLG